MRVFNTCGMLMSFLLTEAVKSWPLEDATIFPTHRNKRISLESGTAATEYSHFPLVCPTRGTDVARRPGETSRVCISTYYSVMYPRILQQTYILFLPSSIFGYHIIWQQIVKVTPRPRGGYYQSTSNRRTTYSNILYQTSRTPA